MKSLEQRRSVQPRDTIQCIRVDRRPQLVQIAVCARRVEEKRVTGREYRVLAECGAQHVHREVEQPAGARQILLRPEHRQGAVPGNWLRPRGHDQCQQRDAVTLRRWTAKRCVPDAQTRAAKKLDCDRHLAANS